MEKRGLEHEKSRTQDIRELRKPRQKRKQPLRCLQNYLRRRLSPHLGFGGGSHQGRTTTTSYHLHFDKMKFGFGREEKRGAVSYRKR